MKENSAFRQTYSTKEKCREKVQRHVIRNEAVLQGVLSTDKLLDDSAVETNTTTTVFHAIQNKNGMPEHQK